LLQLVAGRSLPRVSATLPGARCDRAAFGDWPVLVGDAQGQAEGLLVACDPETIARLDAYEAVFGYHRQDVAVVTETGTVAAQVWRPDHADPGSGAPWNLAHWVETWGPVTLQAAGDILRQLGHRTPAEIGRVVHVIRSRADAELRSRAWRRPGIVGRGFAADDVEIVERRHPYDGFFSVEEVTARFRRFDGADRSEVLRAVFRVTDAATVLPYDPVRDRILLVEQVRFGPLVQGDPSPWLLEPVAGFIDAGESPETSARREAAEEAGLAIGELHFVSRYYPSPGGVSQVLFSYVGIADLPDEAAGLGGHADEHEDILGHVIGFDRAMELMEAGDLVNAPAIISLQWLAMHRAQLRVAAGVS
jgi:nudix-type nucleoside diphosphatase (YffH/AdpP family)